MSAVVVVAVAGWAIGNRGRTTASSAALTAIAAKQREHETRLAALQREIAGAETRAAEARRHAALERCHADAEQIDANVAARAAECVREQAMVAACHAQNEMSKGKSMQGGCAIGLLAAAFLTGGGALLVAGGGCLLGETVGEGNKTECPSSNCNELADTWMVAAAAVAGHQGVPVCELGVEVIDIHHTLDVGMLVRESFLGAASAGLRPGDVVVAINASRTRSNDDLVRAVSGKSRGQEVEVEFVRAGFRHAATVEVSTDPDDPIDPTRPLIGIRSERVASVPYTETRVTKVEGEAASGLRTGDVIERVDEQASLRAIELARRAGDPDAARPKLEVRRKGRLVTIEP